MSFLFTLFCVVIISSLHARKFFNSSDFQLGQHVFCGSCPLSACTGTCRCSEDLRSQLKQLSKQLAGDTSGSSADVNGVTREVLVRSGRSGSVSDEQDVVKKIQFQLSAQAMQLQHANEVLDITNNGECLLCF